MPPALELAAVAMGRLGAAEMSYNSDLDLIFVYHDRGEVAESSRVAASRIVQKFIAVLEARTREGYAYKIDLRLRPSGNAGPLVASLDGFRDYHRTNSAAVWERQALVRARVIAGEPELGAEVEAARREFVFGRGLSRAEVGEIAAMRLRIERELGADGRGRLNIKQGRGGLVDVEFLTQMMALRYGHAHPELTSRATVALVRGIGRCGLLEHRRGRAIGSRLPFPLAPGEPAAHRDRPGRVGALDRAGKPGPAGAPDGLPRYRRRGAAAGRARSPPHPHPRDLR